MRVTDFSFELPESLIAHYPMPECSSCCLLLLDGLMGVLMHGTFTDLLDKLNPGDLLVFNNTCVILACLFGCKASGGKIEVLVEWMLDDKCILVHIRALKVPKPGAELLLGDDESINATMTVCHGALFEVEFNDECLVLDILNSIGHMLLLLYIDCLDEDADCELYQTVYSEKLGVVAALTVGLHFDEPLLEKLCAKGVEMVFVMLHVGVGTFQLVRVDTIEDHIMHLEYAEVLQDVVDVVLVVKARGNWVIVVGTTSVCSLESVAQAVKNDLIELFFDDTQIFIYLGFQYKVVDALVMNFHLPELMLIMLVLAFAGYQHTMNAYKAVVEEKYCFFSYGDVMFIMYNLQAINERVGE